MGTNKKRGGHRPGAGSKPRHGSPIVNYAVKMARTHADILRKYGGGDVSAGLRWLVEASELWIKRKKYPKISTTRPADSSDDSSHG